MKLELEKLAPYLPYGLKILPTCYNRDKKIDTLYYLSIISDSNEFGVNGYTSNYIKPILRPLSDLDQDGEINTPEYLQGCCYSYVQNLISQHYDVFGLIEQGLAIDVNTLTK